MIEIQNGVKQTGRDTWLYEWTDNDGFHKINFFSTIFPQIGGFISGNQYIPRTELKINPDYSKWKDRFFDTAGQDRLTPRQTWPKKP